MAVVAGCTCGQQVPPLNLVAGGPRPVWDVDPYCPVHGLDAMRAFLACESRP